MAGKGKAPERGVNWKKFYEGFSRIKFPPKKPRKKSNGGE